MNVTAQIRQLTENAISDRVFPGAVVGYVRDGQVTVQPFGGLTYRPDAPRVSAETIYDVASITKSVPTSSLVLTLVEQGRLGLDDRVIDYLPEVSNQYREQMLVRHLLTYTVLFELPQGLSRLALDHPHDLIEELMTCPLSSPPGMRYYYTNAPALLLGLIVERVSGEPLDVLAQRVFFGPLGMTSTKFTPEATDLNQIAPTEIDDRGEVRGEPHDEAAWALRQVGRMAGNAGLFSTAGDLLRFGQMLIADGQWEGRQYFEPSTLARLAKNQLDNTVGHTGLGWEIHRREVVGQADRSGMFLKTGFTGCLMVVSPKDQSVLVHLSNRTYPTRPERGPIRAYWQKLCEAMWPPADTA